MMRRAAVLWLSLAVGPGVDAWAQTPAAAPAAPRPAGARLDAASIRVARAAVDALPRPLQAFYRAHRVQMPSQAPEPEFPPRTPERRFMVDRLLTFPFAELPRDETALEARFGERAHGVGRLPWLVHESYGRLLAAMKERHTPKIMAESDLLAGLMVDLHSVLNLTDNFDGQKTGQHGLYVRLMDKLPEAMGPELKLSPEAARYLDDPQRYVFTTMTATYVWLDNTLYLEDLARRGKGGYGEIYFEDLSRRVGPIVRERLSSAASDTASYWYTAWTAAGRPELR